MSQDLTPFPELFIGIAGPIGIDVDGMTKTISATLLDMGYSSSLIKLTTDMIKFGSNPSEIPKKKFDNFMWKMNYANKLRLQFGSEALAAIAIDAVRIERARQNNLKNILLSSTSSQQMPLQRPIQKHCYIIRQFKHPTEIDMMRRVYGQQFILISGYGSESDRLKKLIDDIRGTESTQLLHSEIASKALRLVERDASEVGDKVGQQLRETFHLADLFVDGIHLDKLKYDINRFFYAFFGRADLSPSKREYGMYAAKSASLRSLDLSRQVGAAIFTEAGELIAQGCNEVPKAFGGTYWDEENPDFRDIRKGIDPNEKIKKEIMRDIIERFRNARFLTDDILRYGDDINIVHELIKRVGDDGAADDGILADSKLMDATEYGRTVHAEMCAICDAARTGRSVKDCILYCTTFPCHNCTKHIIAAGIKRVVYLEPYPKSKAAELHADEIEFDDQLSTKKVSFIPFLGISPFRYRNIFQKGRRKERDGKAKEWMEGGPKPLIKTEFNDYTRIAEVLALRVLVS